MGCIRRIALVVATAALLFGCGGAGGGPTVGNPDDPTCSTTSDSSESIGFKTPPGYTASMDLYSNNNDCFAPAGYSTHAQSSVIGGPPFTDPSSPRDPTFKVWLYLSYQFDTTEFLNGLPDVHISVPDAIITPTRQFNLAYDTNDVAPPFVWNANVYAPNAPGTKFLYFTDDTGDLPAVIHNALYQFVLWSTDQPAPSSSAATHSTQTLRRRARTAPSLSPTNISRLHRIY